LGDGDRILTKETLDIFGDDDRRLTSGVCEILGEGDRILIAEALREDAPLLLADTFQILGECGRLSGAAASEPFGESDRLFALALSATFGECDRLLFPLLVPFLILLFDNAGEMRSAPEDIERIQYTNCNITLKDAKYSVVTLR
jgi:hypothetical protein